MKTLPAKPLVDLVEDLGARADLRLVSTNLERMYDRARASGRVSVWTADVLAVRGLGRHPVSVWGEAWWDDHGDAPSRDDRPARWGSVGQVWAATGAVS